MMTSIERRLVVALALLLCAAPPVHASGQKDLEGRWVADGQILVLDFASCGTRFCARLVKADKSCGSTVMTMDEIPRDAGDDSVILEGKLDLPGEPHPYDALAQAGLDPDGKPTIDLTAHDKLHYEERDYAYEAHFSRTGPALCRAEPAS